MSPEDLRIRAHRLVEEILNQGDLAVANELIPPTAFTTSPGGQPASGPARLRDLLSRILRIFPDFHAMAEDVFAAGDQVACGSRPTARMPLPVGRPRLAGC